MTTALPVVAVHGWPVTAEHWSALTPHLIAAGHSVWTISAPGLGVPAPAGLALDKRSLARWLADEIGALGLGPVALMGHDWGGTIAAHAASLAPQLVAALIVEEEVLPGLDVAVPEPGASHYPRWHSAFNAVPGLAEGLVTGREDAYFGAFLRQSAGPAGLDPTLVDRYVSAYAHADVLSASLGHYRHAAVDASATALLCHAPLTLPALAIGGQYGFGEAVGEGLRLLASDVDSVLLQDSGHYPAQQEPAATATAVVQFLRTRGLGLGG